MPSRYDEVTFSNFLMDRQIALVGIDSDGDCEFDEPPTVYEVGSDRLFWTVEFECGELLPFEHKCTDGRTMTCFRLEVDATVRVFLLLNYWTDHETHVLRICPCDCGDVKSHGAPLPADKQAGKEILPRAG